jgi:hypothetical protein
MVVRITVDFLVMIHVSSEMLLWVHFANKVTFANWLNGCMNSPEVFHAADISYLVWYILT